MAAAETLDLTLDVTDVAPLSPSLTRVRLGGVGLAGFRTLGVPDEACVFGFPGEPVLDPSREGKRWYTIRRVEDSALVVDIVRHAGGIGAGWARQARVGDQLQVCAQNSWFRRPADATWQLLVADVAGLPAVSRIVEETPRGIDTAVVVEVADRADLLEVTAPSGAALTVHCVVNPDLHRRSVLERVVRERALPAGPGYVYCAGEAAATRGIRRYLRHERGLPATRYGVIGYWRTAMEEWEARCAASEHDAYVIYEQAAAAGRDDEHVLDLYERRLAEVGLL